MPDGPSLQLRADDSIFCLDRTDAAVLKAIRQDGPLSRSDLAVELGYSRASITAIINDLLASQIIQEAGQGKSGGGRPPLLLDFNDRFGYVAGVDIGATSIDIALADFRGRILQRQAENCDVQVGPEPLLGRVAEMIQAMLDGQDLASDRLVAIGVGVPGPVEFSAGVLSAPPLMPAWEGYPIIEFLRRHFSLARVVVDNDVNILAKGEQQAGAGRGVDNFLFVKVGTGIGCGIIANHEIYRGSDGCAGDIGHICVDYNGPVCHCGNPGCLEFMAAGPAIAKQGMAGAEAGESVFLARRMAENGGMLTAVDVGDAAAAGDRLANEIIRSSGQRIGGVLAGLINFFNPRVIFIGGGVSNIGLQFLSTIRQATLRRSTPLSTRKLRIEYAQLGEDAGVVGAIWLALENVFVVKA